MQPQQRHGTAVGGAVLALAICLQSPGGGIRSQELPDLVAPGASVERIARGFVFVEGPAVDADGALYFTDIPNNRIHRWTAEDGVTTFREESGGANGLRFDRDGTLIACEMGNRRVAAIDPQGGERVLAERYDGRRFNSPNDLWIDARGGIYFSDPRYGPDDDLEMDGHHVYYLTPDRTAVLRVADDLERPNGIIGAPDGTRLYVADHGGGRTYVYTPAADGMLGGRRLFVEQGSDGMTMDERGNVYLTGEDVTVYDPEGNVVGSIAVPEAPANLTFGGPERKTLFITARTSVYAVEMTVSGQ